MTIVTKPLCEDRKKDDKEAVADPIEVKVTDPLTGHDGDSQQQRRSRFRTVLYVSQGCLFILALLAFTVGAIGAFHVYQRLSGHRHVRGWCKIPYPSSVDETLITGDFGKGQYLEQKGHMPEPMLFQPILQPKVVENDRLVEKVNERGQMELDYEMDIDLNLFEILQMPQISHGRFLHDFKVNKTAIIDPDGQRCFVMNLDRNEISPPKSLMDIINKLRNGAFELDLDEIRHDTRVILPPLNSLEGYGVFIQQSCLEYVVYRLEDVAFSSRQIAKRSVQDFKSNGFIEFAGKGLIRYNIINLKDIE